MTGFARADGVHGDRRWTWELKCVNGRGLELRFRLPPGMDHLEPDLRKAAGEVLSRGSMTATLNVDTTGQGALFRVNQPALDAALKLVEQIRGRIDCEKPRAENVLALRGVIETDEADADETTRAAAGAAFISGYREALRNLKAARLREGGKLQSALGGQIAQIEQLTSAARDTAAATLDAIRARIAAQLAELIAGGTISEERLAQEAALLAIKADIREEIDRLGAHIAAARELLAAEEPVGRKLDFLTQEFNREANTLCSKAQDIILKRIGLELKMAIDQFREQVQNIE
jgi:uncharacterized protein (TIGR00255 family)